MWEDNKKGEVKTDLEENNLDTERELAPIDK